MKPKNPLAVGLGKLSGKKFRQKFKTKDARKEEMRRIRSLKK